VLTATSALGADGDLASWRSTDTRERIVSFVSAAVESDSAGYIPPSERVAVFDNDGTLWSEKPAYFQVLFAIDRGQAMLKKDPTLALRSPFKELAAGGPAAVAAGGEPLLLALLAETHTGMNEAEFRQSVVEWIGSARHPVTDQAYTAMIYQPMRELLDYLRDHDFQVWIVSGGTVGFMRPWAEDVYGIPPEQIVGTRFAMEYKDGQLLRQPEVAHLNDKEGKPVGIQQQIGRRPVIAVGNSDGDFAMLEWTTNTDQPSLGLLVHHTDAEREWAYDRESSIGKLDRGLDEFEARSWQLIDMQKDWSRVYSWSPMEK
jgi:phosphoserine phosphatase